MHSRRGLVAGVQRRPACHWSLACHGLLLRSPPELARSEPLALRRSRSLRPLVGHLAQASPMSSGSGCLRSGCRRDHFVAVRVGNRQAITAPDLTSHCSEPNLWLGCNRKLGGAIWHAAPGRNRIRFRSTRWASAAPGVMACDAAKGDRTRRIQVAILLGSRRTEHSECSGRAATSSGSLLLFFTPASSTAEKLAMRGPASGTWSRAG